MFPRVIRILAIIGLLFPYTVFAAENTVDDSASATAYAFIGSAERIVYISDQVGYVFYVDSDNECKYSKTSDAGSTWGAGVTIVDLTTCLDVGVWYDKWTPGDSGTVIHIVMAQDNADEFFYVSLDTSSDTLSGDAEVSSSFAPGLSFAGYEVNPSITKGTDGVIYINNASESNATDKFLIGCSATCATAENWSEKDNPFGVDTTDWFTVMLPLANGDIFIFAHDTTNNDVDYGIYDESGDSWSGWTEVDGIAIEYIATNVAISGTVDHDTNDLYLSFVDEQNSAANGGMDISTYIYNGTTLTQKTDVLSDVANSHIATVRLMRDSNTGDIYAAYVKGDNSNTNTDVYYKKSTDGMETWGDEVGPLNSQDEKTEGLSGNMMSDERLVVVFGGGTSHEITTVDIADLSVAEAVPEFSDFMYLLTFLTGFWFIYTYTQKPQQYAT